MDDRKLFFDQLKERFFPLIRKSGFKGSGNHFRRITNEVIHALNIQGNKYGGSCCVNLGVHLSFLPMLGADPSDLLDLKTVKVGHCLFNKRLAPSGQTDFWWGYSGDISRDTVNNIDHLTATYFAEGEPFFEQYRSVESFAKELHIDDLKEDSPRNLWMISQIYGAVTMARIYKHLGDINKQRMYAEFGLSIIGDGWAYYKKELEQLFK